jgi:hypothetical protein
VTGVSAPLKQRVRAIEETMRAQMGVLAALRRQDSRISPRVRELDSMAIKAELESVRVEVDQGEQHKNELGQEIVDEGAQWIDEKRADLFE